MAATYSIDTSALLHGWRRAYPPRLTTAEVCELARYGVNTLWRRISAGKMPAPIDRGRQAIFDRDAVLQALGISSPVGTHTPKPAEEQNWHVDPIKIAAVRAARVEAAKQERARLKRR